MQISNLFNCWSIQKHEYGQIKKDDNAYEIQRQEAEEWKKNYPVKRIQDVAQTNIKDIKKCVNEITAGLKTPITAANIDIIQQHMINMAKESDIAKSKLIDNLYNFKGDKDLICILIGRLSVAFKR